MTHSVARLRAERLARSAKPFLARGGPKGARCTGCRLILSHCLCALRPVVATRAGMCLIMADIEPLKPSNTGWLIADMVVDTFAFGWARTEVDPALLALLADPQWQPYVVFPGEFVAAERVVTTVLASGGTGPVTKVGNQPAKKPLFVLLDATWPEARKMFRKSPYLNHLPVLSLQAGQLSSYRLRRSTRDDHLCTSEVAAACLALAGEPHAGAVLAAYLEVFTIHYLNAKQQLPVDLDGAAHRLLRGLCLQGNPAPIERRGEQPMTEDATQDLNPQSDLKKNESEKNALCESCAGIQRNWRRAPGHPELMQGTHRTEAQKHGQVTITKYRCERCGTVWEYENNKVKRNAGWSVVVR